MKNEESGFSLFELMVVIAIVGILSTIAIPNFISWRNNAALKGIAFNLKSDMEMAKMRAIRGGGDVVVKFSATLSKYDIFQDYPLIGHSAYIHDPDEPLIVARELPNMSINTTLADNSTAFSNRGLPLKTGTITLRMKDKSVVFTVSRLGSITMAF